MGDFLLFLLERRTLKGSAASVIEKRRMVTCTPIGGKS